MHADVHYLLQFKTLSYPTLAFEFEYPVTTASGRKLPVIISRKPERYSSAAPMTADARQRIVTELVDFPDGITISVSVRSACAFGLPACPHTLHCFAAIIHQTIYWGLATLNTLVKLTGSQSRCLSEVQGILICCWG